MADRIVYVVEGRIQKVEVNKNPVNPDQIDGKKQIKKINNKKWREFNVINVWKILKLFFNFFFNLTMCFFRLEQYK